MKSAKRSRYQRDLDQRIGKMCSLIILNLLSSNHLWNNRWHVIQRIQRHTIRPIYDADILVDAHPDPANIQQPVDHTLEWLASSGIRAESVAIGLLVNSARRDGKPSRVSADGVWRTDVECSQDNFDALLHFVFRTTLKNKQPFELPLLMEFSHEHGYVNDLLISTRCAGEPAKGQGLLSRMDQVLQELHMTWSLSATHTKPNLICSLNDL